jgi:hypothetical protein
MVGKTARDPLRTPPADQTRSDGNCALIQCGRPQMKGPRLITDRARAYWPARGGGTLFCSLLRLIEMPQIRWGLILAARHKLAVRTREIGFPLDENIVVALGADAFDPARLG